MAKGKQTCKILKEIRKQIAAENDIELVISECTYQGDCLGTCPKCEAEVRYLERELEKRQRMGKAAVVAGLSVGLMAASQTAFAQQPDTLKMDTIEKATEEVQIFGMVEEMPGFPGGEVKLMEFIAKNINYPKEAIERSIEGRVFVGFIIDVDGSVTDVKLLRGIGGGCDEEAVRVVKSMPKWRPAKQNGVFSRVSYQIPVNFKLEDKTDKEKGDKKTVKADKVVFENEYFCPSPIEGEVEDPENEVYEIVEQMPEFPGGNEALQKYLVSHIDYWGIYHDYGIDVYGRVFVDFIVEPDGSLTDVRVSRSLGRICDEEAVRVVKSMPKWQPGMQGGKTVRVRYTLPVLFELK
ncbi:MAG: energy transducer TonB [Bacteroidales bacterium]|nr:energy transducer TonB [Bacteroidales bacterium]